MYGKIFDTMYDGTLRADWKAMITMQQLIVLANQDGVVDMTIFALHGRTGIPLDILEYGIDYLSKPDPHSRSVAQDGKRILLLEHDRDWGWQIVNYKHYRDLATREDKRQKDKVRIAKKRDSLRVSQGVAECSELSDKVAKVAYVDVDVDVIKPLSAKNTFSTRDHYLAVHIHSKIKELNPNAKEPNLDKWANEIRLMRERDKRTHDEILEIFTWANNDSFWRTNILSPSKLRKQFDQLTIKSNGESNGSHQQTRKPCLAERLEANRVRAIDQLKE